MTTPLEAVKWIHGAPDCAQSTDPLIQVHAFDDDSFILRISKCYSYEGNFTYLLFGDNKAIIFDTGGPPNPPTPQNIGKVLPIRQTVDGIVDGWLKKRGLEAIDLVVAHTHGHDDHSHWDREFDNRPRTTIVRPSLQSVKTFFGLPNWPNGEATLQLGSRELTILPLPGHQESHIAVYDPRNKWLLTGDTLYAGKLTIEIWSDYRDSATRLAKFANAHEIIHVLGNHIEMKNLPGQLYKIGTTFQPDEHVLPLTAAHIEEFHNACEAMADDPHVDVHDDFIIDNP
ncbi:MBL fold metallo-hydrolase [Bradyrhizobium sp.]|jgi:glyoxylase-like metal-dependent hydrolase (beta-lactamase superfamily II)|uniref:MBL fold metallo-hydrolase n=1 Tax=Bradyrhizobium sp. TaxID=376 RepID=UPI002E184F48